MYYYVTRQKPMRHNMSLEEFLFNPEARSYVINDNATNTRTFATEKLPEKVFSNGRFFLDSCIFDLYAAINDLHEFNTKYERLFEVDRQSLYDTFYIPKKSGGLRRIDAPNSDLKLALYELKAMFENKFGALYHTGAFAYVKGRCTLDAVKKHQSNESKWFAKFDLHDFFGSTTKDFVMNMLSMIVPFSEIIKDERGKKELSKALDLGFLNGGLPQGTPLSPTLTNIFMIPVDFKLANTLRDYNKNSYVYTRYADDFIISSRYNFNVRDIESLVKKTLTDFGAPFSLNSKKTRYGSSSGSNWNLGVMLNKDNVITIGNKKKKQFESMLFSYGMDRKNGKPWSLEDVMVMEGYRNYYRKIEGETIDRIVSHVSGKCGVDIMAAIKEDLKR